MEELCPFEQSVSTDQAKRCHNSEEHNVKEYFSPENGDSIFPRKVSIHQPG
jgi:hypothetical protein